MFINDFLSKDYPAFHYRDSIEEAADIAREFGYSHIFIIKNNIFCGALTREFLEESAGGNIGSLEVHFEKFAVPQDSHLMDSLKIFHIFNANIVPVIDRQERYLGYICLDDVVNEFSKYPLFAENGAILTVQTPGAHYSFSEISQIAESNNTKVYGIFINSITDDYIQITLKISAQNLRTVDETFRRYGYTVVNKFYNDENEELLKDRFGFLQKYLEF